MSSSNKLWEAQPCGVAFPCAILRGPGLVTTGHKTHSGAPSQTITSSFAAPTPTQRQVGPERVLCSGLHRSFRSLVAPYRRYQVN